MSIEKQRLCQWFDRQNIPVSEKMLRLQSSLSGKALTIVKDLGYSASAYERAKEKLEKKYGGQRRHQIKHLTTLGNWKKIRSRNLEDFEEFQAVLERVSLATQNCGSFQLESLNLTAKEKLSEEDVQSYKHWLLDHSQEDNFESLLEWIELRVQVMEEAKEETYGLGKQNTLRNEKNNGSRQDIQRARGYNTRTATRCCIVDKCNQDHPPWVCPLFKALEVS